MRKFLYHDVKCRRVFGGSIELISFFLLLMQT